MWAIYFHKVTGHFAYWTVRLLDISPAAWTVCLQIAHFAYKTAGINSDVISVVSSAPRCHPPLLEQSVGELSR